MIGWRRPGTPCGSVIDIIPRPAKLAPAACSLQLTPSCRRILKTFTDSSSTGHRSSRLAHVKHISCTREGPIGSAVFGRPDEDVCRPWEFSTRRSTSSSARCGRDEHTCKYEQENKTQEVLGSMVQHDSGILCRLHALAAAFRDLDGEKPAADLYGDMVLRTIERTDAGSRPHEGRQQPHTLAAETPASTGTRSRQRSY